VRERLAVSDGELHVRTDFAGGLGLAAGAPPDVQHVVAAHQHLHDAQVGNRVALLDGAAAQLEEADVVVQRVAAWRAGWGRGVEAV